MKYFLIILLFSCSQPSGKIIIGEDSTEVTSGPATLKIQPSYDSGAFSGVTFASLGVYICCDTIRTFNHTAVVKSILDTAGNLTGFEIVKVLK